jgi:hypothetical protein
LSLEVTLLEPGANGCENAHKRGVKRVINADDSALSRDTKYDGVGLFDVLEHLNNPVEILSKLNSSIASGGSIFITVPAYDALWSSADDEAYHMKRYTSGLLKEELLAAGFKDVQIIPFFFTLILPIFLLRRIPYLFSAKKVLSETDSHGASEGNLAKIIEKILNFELFLIKKGFRFWFGSSLFAVCSKSSEK